MCSSKKLCDKEDCQTCFEKSFASHEKSKYWSDKNGVNPRMVFKCSDKRAWFDCECGHEFETVLKDITKNNIWCPYCCNPSKKLCDNDNCQSCFEKSFASHQKSKYWSSKNELAPREVSKGSDKRAWFDCECGHEFETGLCDVTGKKNRWCPYCSNPPKKLCNTEECQTCFEKSFASHEKSKYWSDKNDLNPRQVFKASNNKYWFNCECGHNFESYLANITGNNNRWCPFCANQKLCDKEDCQTCFEKSFASHEKTKYWSDKNDINPRQVFKATGKKYWFDCNKCGHEFENSLDSITGIKNTWCGFCANQKLCDKEDCQTCFEKSFASHEKSKYWSDKNELTSRYVFKVSGKKYWFKCEYNHDFESLLANITKNNCWCPICINKTEKKVYEQLLQIYPSLKTQFRVDWSRNPTTKCYLPFDFVIEEYKIIIELDGLQHFTQIRDWKSPEEHFKTDKYKEQCANDNGYSIIRILQEDVFYDRYDWLTELNENIAKIINEDSVQNIYMGKNKEYNKFVM